MPHPIIKAKLAVADFNTAAIKFLHQRHICIKQRKLVISWELKIHGVKVPSWCQSFTTRYFRISGVDEYPALLFSRVLRKSTPRFVHWSIRVCKSVVHILLFYESCNMTSLPLPKWPRGLKYGSCPPAHDWSSDVSGLVCFRNGISLSKDMVHLSFAIAM